MTTPTTPPINFWAARTGLGLVVGLALVAGCGSSSSPTAGAVASSIAANATASAPTSASGAGTASTEAQTTAAQTTAGETTAGETTAAQATAAQATAGPCELVPADMLATTLGADPGKGVYAPVTAAGTGCRYTKTGADTNVNILVEATPDAANYLSPLAYTAPAGSMSVPGADRGYIVPPFEGGTNATILVVKGNAGVLVTISQDSPPITAANEAKLAAAILRKL